MASFKEWLDSAEDMLQVYRLVKDNEKGKS